MTLEHLMQEFDRLGPNDKLSFFNAVAGRFVNTGPNRRSADAETHWARKVMDAETKKWVDALNPESLEVLEIAGTKWSRTTPFKRYKSVQYPAFDICSQVLDETFDLIIAEQVFEHLLWPFRGGRNVHAMLKPGGRFLITTPFMIRLHDGPEDCTRWTETGIRYFLAECGFSAKDMRTGSWGNRTCALANFFRWVEFDERIHSLANEPDVPVTIWALAQKDDIPSAHPDGIAPPGATVITD